MIIVGDNGLSISEAQSQFALWAIFAAPLLMSNDLRIISDEMKSLLQNEEVLMLLCYFCFYFFSIFIVSYYYYFSHITIVYFQSKTYTNYTQKQTQNVNKNGRQNTKTVFPGFFLVFLCFVLCVARMRTPNYGCYAKKQKQAHIHI